MAPSSASAPRSAADALEDALAQYDRTEAQIHAFAWLDAERARRRARELDALPLDRRGPLWGMVVGVKDIVDTAGIPTECSSALFAGRVPGTSATVVRRLEAAGALIIGKTVTTECAYFHPGPTRNPWNPARTPGGSSMGSAAGVAAGVMPAAVGSQTNGSIIRPAAYCGVIGFKPTFARLPVDGVMPFSPTLDTLGPLARSIREAALVAAVMAGEPIDAWWSDSRGPEQNGTRPRLAVARTADWPHAEPAMRERFERDVAALANAGADVTEPRLPAGLEECLPTHRTIMQFEAHQTFGERGEREPEKFSATLLDYVRGGGAISRANYDGAVAVRARLIESLSAWSRQFDALLTPPTTGEAPTPETTGDPRFCTRWTFTRTPAVTLPTGLGPAGLPLGLQLAGTPDDDARLLRTAAWAEARLTAPRWSLDRLAAGVNA
ncbi:MAG TPA: amidase [Chloroflexota bacterium]|nr:amidase [Chloroflexota bacterium]